MFPIENVISEAQLAANRANSQKSTGPVTEEGKKRSSINARRHGLTGQFQAFSEEDRIAFDRFCNELIAEFNPQGARERVLAIAVAEDHWRLNRARALENNIFAVHLSSELGDSIEAFRPEVHTAATHARTWLKEAHSIQLLTLYESRIRRTIEKNEKQLAELQSARREAVENDIQRAILLTELAEFKGETYDPSEDFPTSPLVNEGGCPAYPGEYGQPGMPLVNEGGCPTYPGEYGQPGMPVVNEGGCPAYPGEYGQPGIPLVNEGECPTYPGEMQSTENTGGQVNGFVFSTAQIARRRTFNTLLAEAVQHSRNGWRKPNSTERPHAQTPKAA